MPQSNRIIYFSCFDVKHLVNVIILQITWVNWENSVPGSGYLVPGAKPIQGHHSDAVPGGGMSEYLHSPYGRLISMEIIRLKSEVGGFQQVMSGQATHTSRLLVRRQVAFRGQKATDTVFGSKMDATKESGATAAWWWFMRRDVEFSSWGISIHHVYFLPLLYPPFYLGCPLCDLRQEAMIKRCR